MTDVFDVARLPRLSRRRLFAAGAGASALAGAGALGRTLRAQSDPSAGRNPFTPPEAAGPAGLLTLLSHVPQILLGTAEGSGIPWYYADVTQQFEAVGIERGEQGPDDDAPLAPVLRTLATASRAYQYAFSTDLTDAIGFNPLAVDQTLLVGDPPNQLTLFRGGLRPAALVATWRGSGYQPIAAADGTPIYTIGSDFDVDLAHPVQSIMLSAFNNLALIDDVLLCAPTLELLESALATRAGKRLSAAQDAMFTAALRTLPATTVSAVAVHMAGIDFFSAVDPTAAAEAEAFVAQSDAEVGPMPSYDGLIVAVEAGAITTDDGAVGQAMVRLGTESSEDAEQALAVVDYRWNEGNSLLIARPFNTLMEIAGTGVDGAVAMIDFELVQSSSVWLQMVISYDLLPFAPGPPG